MKKAILFFLGIVICLSLCSCGKSDSAKNCEKLIATIGVVTLESEDILIEAEEAYAALSEEDKKQIEDSANQLFAYREEFEQLRSEDRIKNVVKLIDSIGEVSNESEEAIMVAEDAIEKLSDDEAEIISEAANKLVDIRKEYDALIEAEKLAEMQENANVVIESISKIGTVTLESNVEISIAKELFSSLSSDEQALVCNYEILAKAEKEYNLLVAEEKNRIIKECEKKFEIDEDKIDQITWYFHKKMPDYIDIRGYIIPYIGYSTECAWICIRYNYTGDDWIFWDDLKIYVDGVIYNRNFDYHDIVRDNDGGNVWEWYDDVVHDNAGLDNSDLSMLDAIASSEETIIRFEGDTYEYDLVVSSADKQLIREVLTLYQALIS